MLNVLFVAFFFWQSTFELTKIEIQGLSRFEPAAVMTTVGLKTDASAGKPEFDAACQRLIATGLFEACNWKYAPTSRTGIALTFNVKEADAGQKVRLTVPGVDDKQLWEWLRVNEPLVQPQMPGSDDAIQFYTRAIQRFVKKDVVASVHTNLETRENTLVFRPADVSTIASVKFTGGQVIDGASLEKTFAPIAQGTPFTEYDVQKLLDLNIRPLYENLGRLNVSFPSIKAEGGALTVHVEEGRVYTLGSVEIAGLSGPAAPKLQIGETAQWNKIVTALDTGSKGMRDEGYLQARYKVDRKLNHEAGTVALNVSYTPGPRFTFNALRLEGLNTAQEARIRALWKLPAGEPMNESYVDQFLREAFEKLGPEFNGVAHQLEPAGKTSVDVVVTFRRQ